MPDRMNPGLEDLDVSRETFDRLSVFATMLGQWNSQINLVSRQSLPGLWNRHIADSIQVFRLGSQASRWVDIGTGGGFPGLVAAILSEQEAPGMRVTLVESNHRKCAFLGLAARTCGVSVEILPERIETTVAQGADVLSARAVGHLARLLSFAERHLCPGGVALFPKGESWKREVEEARVSWNFDCEAVGSNTYPDSVILKVSGVSRA